MLVLMNASPTRPSPADTAPRTSPDTRPWTALGPEDAPGIVFLHGTRLTRAQWWPQLRRLAGAYRCVAVDLPGHGVLADRPFTIEAATDLVRAAIEAEIPSGRAVIVGLSLGGYVAIDTAEAYPERVSGLVLAGCSGEAFGPMSWPYRFFRALLERAPATGSRSRRTGGSSGCATGAGSQSPSSRAASGHAAAPRRSTCSSGADTLTASAGCGRPSSWSTGHSTRSSGREASTGRRPAGGVATSSSPAPCTCRTWIARAPSPAWSPGSRAGPHAAADTQRPIPPAGVAER